MFVMFLFTRALFCVVWMKHEIVAGDASLIGGLHRYFRTFAGDVQKEPGLPHKSGFHRPLAKSPP